MLGTFGNDYVIRWFSIYYQLYGGLISGEKLQNLLLINCNYPNVEDQQVRVIKIFKPGVPGFLKLILCGSSVCVFLCVCACVCPRPRLLITSGVI